MISPSPANTISNLNDRTEMKYDGITLRMLTSSKDFAAFEALQKDTWGQNLVEVVTESLARIIQRIGGIAAGAFDRRGEMQGLVFGFTGFSEGVPVHWSHMLAVRNGFRDSGIGRMLKQFQRDALLPLGVKKMYWSFDPLVAKNAHLNFNNLGVEATEYIPEMYGPGEDSELFRGLGTDRLIVLWRIASDVVAGELEGHSRFTAEPYLHSPIIVNRTVEIDEYSPPGYRGLLSKERCRIEIPPDIHALRAHSIETAAQWRATTRAAFETCFEKHFTLSGFYRDQDSHRCFYCLQPSES